PLCRLEFWHFRQQRGASATPHDAEESFSDVLQRCGEVTQDIEFRINDIDELIASLEETKAKCEEQLRLLAEVKSNAETGEDDAAWLDDDLQDAILKVHENPLEGSGVTDEVKEILARTWPESDRLRADAESLHSETDSIETDADLPALLDSVWM